MENNELIARWLSGDLSEEERKQLAEREELKDLNAVLEDVSSWSLPPADVEAGLQAIKLDHSKQKPKTRTLIPFLRVAAALVLVAIFWFAYDLLLNPSQTLLETTVGETIEHELPDGSLLTLGPVSSATYSPANWQTERALNLSGKGFFDVKAGAPFTVITALGSVSVLGTQFDITEGAGTLTVRCYEGSVSVVVTKTEQILNAGEGVTIDGSGSTDKFTLTRTEPGWVSGRSVFQNQLLSTVCEEMTRYFEVVIELPDRYQEMRFTGGFSHTNLRQALDAVFQPLEIRYTISPQRTVVFE